MLFAFLDSFRDWLVHSTAVERLLRLQWQRLADLFIGEKIALGTLAVVGIVGSIAAVNRYFAGHFGMPVPRESVKTPRRAKGFGVKHLVLLLVALLPGGMVGVFTVYTTMGRENWRRDAVIIVGGSLLPAMLMVYARTMDFPWPHLRNAVYFSGLVGLIFALLQIWALIKLLREWWGEPDECVPWWPPMALWLQLSLLIAATGRILAG